MNNKEKIVIYKCLDKYCATPESNYGKRISNARLVQKLDGFKNPREIMDYYNKYCKTTDDDFIIKESVGVNSNSDAPIRIFLTNLGKYNEGELVGEWVDLPVDDDFEQAFKDIGIGKRDEFGQPYEEYFITDYETDFDIDIGEYSDIFALNDTAIELDELDGYEKEIVLAYLDGVGNDIDDAIASVDDAIIYRDCKNMTDVAWEYINEMGGLSQFDRNVLETYFDYESFGRELQWDFSEEEMEEYGFNDLSDYEIGERWIYDVLGDISELGDETLSNYFDYESFGNDMYYDGDFVFTDNGDCVVFY